MIIVAICGYTKQGPHNDKFNEGAEILRLYYNLIICSFHITVNVNKGPLWFALKWLRSVGWGVLFFAELSTLLKSHNH